MSPIANGTAIRQEVLDIAAPDFAVRLKAFGPQLLDVPADFSAEGHAAAGPGTKTAPPTSAYFVSADPSVKGMRKVFAMLRMLPSNSRTAESVR